MVHATAIPQGAGRLGRIREVLSLLGKLRKLGAPLGSPDGVRRLLELALKLAELAGADESLLEEIRKVLADEQLLAFLAGVLGRIFGRPADATRPAAETQAVEAQAAIDWLPLIVQLLKLLASLRGAK